MKLSAFILSDGAKSTPGPMSIQTLDSLRNDEALENPKRLSQRGTPTWEVAYFYPRQGEWEESDYLSLSTNWMIEFDDGCIEVLPMPTLAHQLILDWLLDGLNIDVTAMFRAAEGPESSDA